MSRFRNFMMTGFVSVVVASSAACSSGNSDGITTPTPSSSQATASTAASINIDTAPTPMTPVRLVAPGLKCQKPAEGPVFTEIWRNGTPLSVNANDFDNDVKLVTFRVRIDWCTAGAAMPFNDVRLVNYSEGTEFDTVESSDSSIVDFYSKDSDPDGWRSLAFVQMKSPRCADYIASKDFWRQGSDREFDRHGCKVLALAGDQVMVSALKR